MPFSDQSSSAPDSVVVDWGVALDMLEILRLTPIYALLNSEHEDQLGEDFKPHKWQGYEAEHAERATVAFRVLLAVMERAASDEERQDG